MDSNQQEIHIISKDPHDADIEILEASSPTSCHNLVPSATTTMTENPAMHRDNGAEMPPLHDNTSDSDSHPRTRRQPYISSSSSSISPRSLSMQRAMLMMDRALTRSTKIGAAIVQLELSRASGRQQATQVSSLRSRRYTMPDVEQQQQDQQHEDSVRNANADDNAQQEEGYKRRRVSSVSAPADNAAALSSSLSLSLCERQGALPPRTQRLSALLQHLQVTHQLLMEEMQARCCCTEEDDEEDDDNDK